MVRHGSSASKRLWSILRLRGRTNNGCEHLLGKDNVTPCFLLHVWSCNLSRIHSVIHTHETAEICMEAHNVLAFGGTGTTVVAQGPPVSAMALQTMIMVVVIAENKFLAMGTPEWCSLVMHHSLSFTALLLSSLPRSLLLLSHSVCIDSRLFED